MKYWGVEESSPGVWNFACATAELSPRFNVRQPDRLTRAAGLRAVDIAEWSATYAVRYVEGNVVVESGGNTKRGALNRLSELIRARLKKSDWPKDGVL